MASNAETVSDITARMETKLAIVLSLRKQFGFSPGNWDVTKPADDRPVGFEVEGLKWQEALTRAQATLELAGYDIAEEVTLEQADALVGKVIKKSYLHVLGRIAHNRPKTQCGES